MAPTLPTLDDLRAAEKLLEGRVLRTPLLAAPFLAEETGAAEVWLKPECLQPGGAFKIRGGTHFLLRHGKGASGVITYSSGNHAVALASAARGLSMPCTVVVPEDITATKLDLLSRLGAEVHRCGTTSLERQARAEELAKARSLLMVPPFDHPSIVAGQGTAGLELARDLPAGVEAVLVPCGGGGLLSGIALALSSLRPEVAIYAVEPSTADAMSRSLEAGKPVRVDPGPTLADGLKPSLPGEINLALCQGRVREGLRVEDQEILWAVARLLLLARLVVEPSGAVPLAALRAHRRLFEGRRVALVLTGGNASPAVLARALASLTP